MDNFIAALKDPAEVPEMSSDQPLPAQIAGYIRNLIIHDILKPGESVRERFIADTLNVSRTPMRDALKILSVERLVKLYPNRSAVVVDNSLEDITDMLSVYVELDKMAATTACRMASETDFLRIERHIEEMRKAQVERNRSEYFRANQNFHFAIVSAARNQTLAEMHMTLNLRLYRVRYLAILSQEIWTTREDEHRAMLNALRARDQEELAILQKEHFAVAWRLIDDWCRSAAS
ncbi:GntR family transcriptional regulator [Citreicella sp. C3M06]|uniref:GntR family transcriptional regulator n=1 Tax=Citreicella sp. C3M06 TaxID=2841564 RepID=UPI001C0A503B|nr:GntR family transcriptional regulator [Citreicella sp. C3M06]MBU2961650.1 GntR family transcriptional regulator [Citreicella sp. C3M06]